MKHFLLFLLFAISSVGLSENQKISELTKIYQRDKDDLLYIVDDPNGTPVSRAIPIQEFTQTFNVKDYGATGDGTTDDTTAFQSALTAASVSGGVVYLPAGDYAVDTASLGALASDAIAIAGDNVTIRGAGAGQTTIQMTGTTTGCSIFLGTGINNLIIEGIKFVGLNDTVADNSALRITGSSTEHMDGFTIRDCEFHDFKSTTWVRFLASSGSYDIRHIHIEDCRFYSFTGDRYSDTDGVASDLLAFDTNGPGGYVRHVLIKNCYMDAEFMRKGISLKDGVQHARVEGCYILNTGTDLATDERECYAIMAGYGSGCSDIWIKDCELINPWTCGIYSVGAQHLHLVDNYVTGQVDVSDSTLCTGAYAIAAVTDLTITGGLIEDCAIALQVGPYDGWNSKIVINGVTVENCTDDSAFTIRENALFQQSGGVTITNCHLKGTDITINRNGSGGRVGNITISNNIIHDGKIRFVVDVYDAIVTNNRIYNATNTRGIEIGGAAGLMMTGNQVYGPGPDVASSYGIFMQYVSPPAIIANNTVVGFLNGYYGVYVSGSFHGNRAMNCTNAVANGVAGDLGRDDPSTIAGAATAYNSRGDYIETMYPTAALLGWKCTAPTEGMSCTYTTTTTADMTDTEFVITDVAAIGRYIPGVAITLGNAATGPATLSTEILYWRITYDTLVGTFSAGERISDNDVAFFLGMVESDNGTTSMDVCNIPYTPDATLAVGDTIKGHTSAATAEVTAISLVTVDACGATVDDETLSLVTPTWVTVAAESGYTDLTDFVDQTAWRFFYSNGDKDVKEVALGTDGQVLTSTGVDSAPGFEDAPGAAGGDAWGDAVDADIVPDTDDAYNLGDSTHEFTDGWFDGTLYADVLSIPEGGLADAVIVDADIKDDTLQEPALNSTNAPTDNYVLSYNLAGTNFTWVAAAGGGDMTKAVYDSGESGGVDKITTVDATTGTHYLTMTETAVGTDTIKTDGALSYDPATGTLAATGFSGGGASLTAVDAATGDSATDFFDAGEIPDNRISNTLTSSTCTGNSATATSAATVAIDEDPTNAVASGMTTTFTVATNVVFGDVCYIDSAGKMEIGDADATASSMCIGMAIATINADASGNFLLLGIACDTDWDWTVGGTIYLTVTGTSTNTLSQTAPSGSGDVVRVIGVATHADRMLFNTEVTTVVHD